MRKAEARKVTQANVSAAEADATRERWRELEMANRRLKLFEAGAWPPPEDWADDLLSSDYEPPVSETKGLAMNFGDALREARLRLPRMQEEAAASVSEADTEREQRTNDQDKEL
jgi:hypothetical protein